ncbi:MAG TPA: sulfite exporter TauE/SafE family protein [Candidatus Omnitrophota bacterium]|nr:sulfite exporter TauE/SafE family protein [Candidatus Omnitrophota bacterium]
MVSYIVVGLIAGIASGFLGIGGGVVIIPILVYFFGLTQHQAQGTTLALMIPPIGLLAAIKYYRDGNVDVRIAALICTGFIVGGLLGAYLVSPVPDHILRRIFGVFLLGIAVKMIYGR